MKKQQVFDIISELITEFSSKENEELLNELEKEVDALPNDDWISVDDRLPEYNKEVMCTDGKYIRVVKFMKKKWVYNYCNIVWITHWVPLPELPSVKK